MAYASLRRCHPQHRGVTRPPLEGRIVMKRVLGATAALLVLLGAVIPSGHSVGAGSWDWPKGQPLAGSWGPSE